MFDDPLLIASLVAVAFGLVGLWWALKFPGGDKPRAK